jgi:hypothetical protein
VGQHEPEASEPADTLVCLVALSAQLSALDIVAAVGLDADDVWNRGEPYNPKWTESPLRQVSGARYRSRLPATASAEAQLAELLARLRPFRERIAALSAPRTAGRSEVVLRVWVHTIRSGTCSCAFDFSPDQLRELAHYGAHLGMEVVCADRG